MEDPDEALLDQKRLGHHTINQSLVANNPVGEQLTVGKLEVPLKLMKNSWHTFNSNDLIIQRHAERSEQRNYFKNNYYPTAESAYIKYKCWFKSQISLNGSVARPTIQNQVSDQPVNARTSSEVILEPITLPIFSRRQKD